MIDHWPTSANGGRRDHGNIGVLSFVVWLRVIHAIVGECQRAVHSSLSNARANMRSECDISRASTQKSGSISPPTDASWNTTTRWAYSHLAQEMATQIHWGTQSGLFRTESGSLATTRLGALRLNMLRVAILVGSVNLGLAGNSCVRRHSSRTECYRILATRPELSHGMDNTGCMCASVKCHGFAIRELSVR